MVLKEYLKSVLGNKKACELYKALKNKKLIIISGKNGSGKTTLAKMLCDKGYHAVEDFEVYQLNLDEKVDNMA